MASFVMGSDARELHKNAVSSRATMLQKLEEVPWGRGQDGWENMGGENRESIEIDEMIVVSRKIRGVNSLESRRDAASSIKSDGY